MKSEITFIRRSENGGWVSLYFQCASEYALENMLKAMERLVEDDGFEVRRVAAAKEDMAFFDVTQETSELGWHFSECEKLKEEIEVINLAGISSLLEAPVSILLYAGSDIIKLQVRDAYYQLKGAQLFEEFALLLGVLMKQ